MTDKRQVYSIDKHIMPGTLDGDEIIIHIEFKSKKLSITGESTTYGGQIGSHLEGRFHEIVFNRPWNKLAMKKLMDIWNLWHLNHMRAGCEHQRAAKWEDKRIDPADLPNSRANQDESGILAIWVRPEEHAGGLMAKPCPTCGYKYGTEWLNENVPNDILLWLDGLERMELDGDSGYEHKANTFLKRTGAILKVEFLKTAKYFDDDEYPRDIYDVTITRGDRSFTIKFGNSVKASGRWWKHGSFKRGTSMGVGKNKSKPIPQSEWDKNPNFEEPSAYDVLAAIQKTHPGAFRYFCEEMGYDQDSKKSEKIYNAVVEEATNLERLFSSEEIKELQDIQ